MCSVPGAGHVGRAEREREGLEVRIFYGHPGDTDIRQVVQVHQMEIGQGQWCNWGKCQAGKGKRKFKKSVSSAVALEIQTALKVILGKPFAPQIASL